ncbi:MAG: hypothetical protein RIQ46_1133 [Pseudomonadota bacterium]|jgi:hypothetical protein
MNGRTSMLPEGYQALEPFVVDWALPTQAERASKRSSSTPDEKRALYEAARGILPQALAELDAKPFDRLNQRERMLLNVLLSYAQVALSIEVRGDGEALHAQDRRHMTITREPTPLATLHVR